MPTEDPTTYSARKLEELKTKALNYNCVLVVAKANELLLDLDNYSGGEFHRWRADRLIHGYRSPLKILHDKFTIVSYTHWPSRNGHLHVCVQLERDIDPGLAIALQAALGSDSRREIIACWEREMWVQIDTQVFMENGKPVDTRALFMPHTSKSITVKDPRNEVEWP